MKYKKEKELIDKLLDIIVEMSEHCMSMKSEILNKSKCSNCGFKRDFGLSNNGCLLVDILENYELVDVIIDTCRYQEIVCEDKLEQAMRIFKSGEKANLN